LTAWVRFLVRAIDVLFKPALGADPTFTVVGIGALFLGVERPGREANHSPLSTADVVNVGAIPPLPCTPSWCSAELI
jgi:hypothetical protein